MWSEQSHYYAVFNEEVRSGRECVGESCKVWFLSEVDTWHECACNRRRAVPVPHPEADDCDDFAPVTLRDPHEVSTEGCEGHDDPPEANEPAPPWADIPF